MRSRSYILLLGLAFLAPSRSTAQPAAAPQPAPAPTPAAAKPAAAPDAAASEEQPGARTGKPLPGLAERPAGPAELPRPPADRKQRKEWLRQRLDEVFAARSFGKAKISAIVTDSASGEVVYSRSPMTLLNAASNVKIVTSAAALALLGAEYRWRTAVYATIPTEGPLFAPGGELRGDLYIRGFGDPTFSDRDLAAMVGELHSLGLRKVQGGLVVDESFFDGAHVGPAFDQKQDSSYFRAPSSAASLNRNTVAVTITPAAQAGAPARVLIEPASPYFVVAGQVTTTGDGPASPIVETQADGASRTRIMLGGRIKVGAEARTFYRRVAHPQLFLAATLRQLLEKRGIAVEHPIRTGMVPVTGVRVLSLHESAPLGIVVHDLNKRSDNFTAEQVVRTLGAEIVGRPGSWAKGLEAVSRYLAAIGIARGSYQMKNGSGLYDSNRFSAQQIASVVRAAMHDFRISSEFLASLAVAGTDGTIAHRMAGSLAERYVRAKTGTLQGTSCLSGVAGAPGKLPMVFSILMNELTDMADARRAQDRIAELLVAYLEGPDSDVKAATAPTKSAAAAPTKAGAAAPTKAAATAPTKAAAATAPKAIPATKP